MLGDLHYLDLLEVSDRIRRQQLTSQTVIEAQLERIHRLDPGLRSVVRVLEADALARSAQADAEIRSGRWRGPLHGVPIGIKDDIDVAGVPTTCGTRIFADRRPELDATVVERLKDAGAVILAKLQMAEGAWMECHPSFEPPVNPWSPAHWTGQSSSGPAVAVAAGFCYGALGSDMGGSIRLPACANSVTGIKPTWGLVSNHGILAAAESLEHVGPIARTAADAAAILQVIAGTDDHDANSLSAPVPDYLAGLAGGLSDVVIGIDRRFATQGVAPEVHEAIDAALHVFRELGASVREVAFPDEAFDPAEIMPLFLAEVATVHRPYFEGNEDLYGPRLRALLQAAEGLGTPTIVRAYQARARFSGTMNRFFRAVDLIITPGLAILLPSLEEIELILDDVDLAFRAFARFTVPFNVAGVPTISLPAGFDRDGRPIGIQLVGRRLGEALLCRAGHAFQRATDFHTRRAPAVPTRSCP